MRVFVFGAERLETIITVHQTRQKNQKNGIE
jgi:hypothetical protein